MDDVWSLWSKALKSKADLIKHNGIKGVSTIKIQFYSFFKVVNRIKMATINNEFVRFILNMSDSKLWRNTKFLNENNLSYLIFWINKANLCCAKLNWIISKNNNFIFQALQNGLKSKNPNDLCNY